MDGCTILAVAILLLCHPFLLLVTVPYQVPPPATQNVGMTRKMCQIERSSSLLVSSANSLKIGTNRPTYPVSLIPKLQVTLGFYQPSGGTHVNFQVYKETVKTKPKLGVHKGAEEFMLLCRTEVLIYSLL